MRKRARALWRGPSLTLRVGICLTCLVRDLTIGAMKTKTMLLSCACLLVGLAQVSVFAEPGHDFARWEKEIAALEQADKTSPPPQGSALFIGSSTIKRWTTLAQDFPEFKVINRGFGGSQIIDSTYFAERIIFPLKPKQIFLRAGGNDLNAGKSPEEVFGDYKDFVTKVQGKLPETEIVFISVSHTVARWKLAEKEKAFNGLVKEFVSGKPKLKYIETGDMALGADGKPREELFVADKLHFNAEGYKLLVENVRPFLVK
jgi:lysophospholipase L1-like esterase